jgi:hypothetical protein
MINIRRFIRNTLCRPPIRYTAALSRRWGQPFSVPPGPRKHHFAMTAWATRRRHPCPMPLSFRGTEHPAWIVGQDGILRAGWQPALVGLFTGDPGGLPTRRRLPTCPTTSVEFLFLGKLSGIGHPCRQSGTPRHAALFQRLRPRSPSLRAMRWAGNPPSSRGKTLFPTLVLSLVAV